MNYPRIFLKQIWKRLITGRPGVLGALKYYGRWKKSFTSGGSTMSDRTPWLTCPAIDLLQRIDFKDKQVFEFGGGGSTLWFCDRGARVTTTEHDTAWFHHLQQQVQQAAWQGNSIAPRPGLYAGTDPANPADYYSADAQYSQHHFHDYAASIDAFADGSFFLVLIDGRARTSCLHHALKKVAPGGYLILDNAERSYYTEKQQAALQESFDLILNTFAPVPYSTAFSQTNIWRRK